MSLDDFLLLLKGKQRLYYKYRQNILTKQENRQIKLLIKQRILEYIEFQGMSMYSFYRDSGITRNTFSAQSGISELNLMKFRRYAPEVSLHWLVEGKGEMFQQWAPIAERDSFRLPDKKNFHYAPEIRLSRVSDVKANYRIESKQAVSRTDESIPLYELKEGKDLINLLWRGESEGVPIGQLVTSGAPPCDGGGRVSTDNFPLFGKGDIIFYRKCSPADESVCDGLCFILYEDHGKEIFSIRKISTGSTSWSIRLEDDDSGFVSQEISRSEIRAMAKIVGSIRFGIPKDGLLVSKE